MIGRGDIGGCILAGGQSRRMGADKAALLFAGSTLLDRSVERLAPQVATIAVNLHQGESSPGLTRCPILADPPGDHQGPLAGVLAALTWAERQGLDWIATAPVDSPFFPRDLVARLAEAVVGRDMAIAHSGGRSHPVFGLWKTTLVPALARSLAAGRRSAGEWVAAQQAGVADWPSAPYDPFFNINQAADLDAALRIEAEHRP